MERCLSSDSLSYHNILWQRECALWIVITSTIHNDRTQCICSFGHCPNNIIKQIHYKIHIDITHYLCSVEMIIKSIFDMTCQAYMLKSSSHLTPHRHQHFIEQHIEHLQVVADVIFLGNNGAAKQKSRVCF